MIARGMPRAARQRKVQWFESWSGQHAELACVLALVVIFICFTWRGLTMFFSGDDMMNMYKAWSTPALKIWKAQVLPWMPISRPPGTGIYRIFYSVFGFHPLPLYIFCWLLLVANIFAVWRFFRAISSSVFVALLALSLTLVHGAFQDLYLSAGTIYDRLCFLFTVLAVIAYIRMGPQRVVLLTFLCLMAMNSKESGAALPAILFCYECVYRLPAVWREQRIREWIRSIAPIYGLLAVIVAAFVFGRVRRTEDIIATAAYHPHFSFQFWLSNVTEYLDILLYRHVHFTDVATAVVLLAMLALAAALRNRELLFGWLYFVIAITPVALISVRQGYVLYVPFPGLGLYAAALIGLATQKFGLRGRVARAALWATATALIVWIHASEWPEPWRVSDSPEWRLAEKMQRDYPALKPGAKILFVDDYPAGNGYDTMFVLRLLYRDPQIQVFRLKGPAVQQPDRDHRSEFPAEFPEFDHVFTTAQDTYVELDRRNVEESIRLNILQDYSAGRDFDAARSDRAGYPVSGVLTSGHSGEGWWTMRSARLKFDLYPADSKLTLKFRVSGDEVAGAQRKLSVIVDGETLGAIPLTNAGESTVSFPVPARDINPSGFTILELDIDRPYARDGQEYGVALLRAAFDYALK
jgi:hypothetical protein